MEEIETTRQCTATNRDGERCRRTPIRGGYVCRYHGGLAPAVASSARARLLVGVDFAIDYLLNMLEPREPCPTCGRSDVDRDPVIVKACQLVLDRSGFGPSAKLEVTPSETTITRIERVIIYPDGTQRQLNVPTVEGFLLPEGEDDEDPTETPVHHETAQFPSGNAPPPSSDEEVQVAADWLRGLDVRGVSVSLRRGSRLELRPASAYKQMSDHELIVLRHHRIAIKQLVASGAWQSMS